MTTPMNPAGAFMALACVHPSPPSWSGLKGQLYAVVARDTVCEARPDTFVELAQSELVELVGRSVNCVRKAAAELVDQRVLERDDGAGTAGHAYRINPLVREWRVRWSMPLEVVELRVGKATGAIRASTSGVAARSRGASQSRFAARPRGARLERSSRAPQDRAASEALAARPWTARQANEIDDRHCSLEISGSLSGPVGRQSDHPDVALVVGALEPRATKGGIFGGLLEDVRAIVGVGVDVERLVHLITAAPPVYQAPKALQWAVDELRRRHDLEAARAAEDERRRRDREEAELVDAGAVPPPPEVAAAIAKSLQKGLANGHANGHDG